MSAFQSSAENQTLLADVPGAPNVGKPIDRTDGILKVTGRARYAAEHDLPAMSHAVMVTSTIAKGRILAIDVASVQVMPGVLYVMTYLNAPALPGGGNSGINPPAGRILSLLQTNEVHYSGEPVALVVAETLEDAKAGADALRFNYAVDAPAASFHLATATPVMPKAGQGDQPDSTRGDMAGEGGVAHFENHYTTPTEHHNAMEPHATVAVWQANKLTLYDSTQYITGVKTQVAKTLGIDKNDVHVVCKFTGGGFGSKGSTWSHVALAAMAARQVGRPVKLALERVQMFGAVGARPRTLQTIAMSADADGKIRSLRHDSISATSMIEDWLEPSAMLTRMLYSADHVSTSHRLARMNIGTPTFMRAPGESSGSFALEVAMDEMASALNLDPIEFRLRNYASSDPDKNKPFSSKHLRECYAVGAERFGWARRSAFPAAMRVRGGMLGMGMASATYPAKRAKASAVARLLSDGTLRVESGTQDLGTGTYTIMTQIAADAAGFPIHKVIFELGDSLYPEAPVSGGSQSAAGVGPAVATAARQLRAKLIALATTDPASNLYRADPLDVTIVDGWLVLGSQPGRREAPAALAARSGGAVIEAFAETQPGEESKSVSMHSFGAVFAAVRVEDTGVVRIERIVGVYDIGQLLNAKTGRSQLLGGIVWGIGMALTETTELDPRYGRFVNGNLGEYHVPVNADVRNIDITVIPGHDPYINELGARGIGEIGITGVAAAISNAVYNATGKRVRDLPITLDRIYA